MKSIISRLASLLAVAVALSSSVGCGGGTAGAGAPPTAAGPTGVATLDISTSAQTLRTGSTDAATITVVAKDSNNRVLPNVVVSFASDSGTVAAPNRVTDASGSITATVNAGADRSNRPINVEARSGAIVAQVALRAVGTSITLTAPPSGASGADIPVSVTVSDGNSLPVAGATVALTLNGAAQPSSLTTGANGQASTTVRPTAGGTLELGASALGATATPVRVSVASDAMTVTVAPTTLTLGGTGGAVAVSWTQNGTAVSQQVRLSTTKGLLRPIGSTVVGSQSIIVIPSGPATPVATLIDNGVVGDSVVTAAALTGTVSASTTASFASTQPGSFTVQVASNTITGTTGTAKVDVFVVDSSPSRNPVQGAVVSFFIVSDPTGGSIDQATAVTDAAGKATVTFRPGSRPTSGTDAVVIGASVGTLGTATASLTVAGGPLFVSIGFGNTIQKPTDTEYRKVFNIRVTNSAGNAVSGAAVTVRLRPVTYRKGQLAFSSLNSSGSWGYGLASPVTLPSSFLAPGQADVTAGWYIECPNEDYTNDGILDPSKDFNQSGALEPRQVASVFFSGPDGAPAGGALATTGVTQSDGSAYIAVQYSQRFAPWVTYEIQVSTAVGGSEGRAQLGYLLIGAADDFTNQTVAPAGRVSPFGIRLNTTATGSFTLPNSSTTPNFTWPSMPDGCRQKD
jgi:hypothetical protein